MHHSKRLAAYTFAPLVAAVLAVTAVTVQACRVRTLRAADAPENVDVRAVGVSTDTVWFEVSCAPVADENGAADAYIDSVFVGSTLVHAARVTVPADTSWHGVTIRSATGELAPGERRVEDLAIASL